MFFLHFIVNNYALRFCVFYIYRFCTGKPIKLPMNRLTAKAGIGIYITCRVNSEVIDVFSSPKAANIATPIQADAAALVTAAHIAYTLILKDPIFFTDILNLARAANALGAKDPTVLWEIRRQAMQFQELTKPLKARIIHVGRQLNRMARAQHAMHSSRTFPICSYKNTTHSNLGCSVAVAVQRLHLSEL
jgi:hypothetical protein